MSSNPNDSDDRERSESDATTDTTDTTGTAGTADEGTSTGQSHSGSGANAGRSQPRGERGTGGAGAAAGQAAGQALDSARNRLSTPAAISQIKYVLGLFALVGAGFGVTGFLIIELLAGGGGGIGAQAAIGLFSVALLMVVLLIGPVVAVYSGSNPADGLYQEPRTAYLTSFVSNFAGYLVMVLIAVLLISVAGGGSGTTAQTDQTQFGETPTAQNTGSNTFDIVPLLVPMALLSIPVGLVGLGSAYLHRSRSAPA